MKSSDRDLYNKPPLNVLNEGQIEQIHSATMAVLDGVDYLNPITDERRRFTSEDCRITATISNALSNCSWSMILGLAADVPADIADRVIAKQALTYCEKPLFFCCSDPNLVHDLGLLDHSAVISPDYLVLVDEILSMVNQINGTKIPEIECSA